MFPPKSRFYEYRPEITFQEPFSAVLQNVQNGGWKSREGYMPVPYIQIASVC